MAGEVRRIKAFLNWASGDDEKLIPKPEYGKRFVVSKKSLRKLRNDKGRLDLPSQDILRIIEASSIQYKPIVLLGINCGMGQKDISDLLARDLPKLDGDVYWRSDRGKNGGIRKFWLWPETAKAIAEYQAYMKRLRAIDKGRARKPEWEKLLFRTAQGNAWVTEGDGVCKDGIGWQFRKLRKELGISRGTFYDLRRTFETVANETLDQMAVNLVMGHVPPDDDMPSRYLQNIANERIRLVCAHVRKWLFN